MSPRRPIFRRALPLFAGAACFAAGAATFAVAGGSTPFHNASRTTYVAADGTRIAGTGLTGAGLPDVGGTSTYGVAELATSIRAYHDSGAYDKAIAKVDARAEKSVKKQLRRLAKNPGPGRYSACHKGKCKAVKPALVLDIDETSLSNYTGLEATNFSQVGLVTGAATGTDTVIAPTLKLYELARRKGVKVAFITGRPSIVETPTRSNLESVGYDKGYSLTLKPSGPTTIAYKSGERKKLTQAGFTIIANVGDQDSDLEGGFAKRSFKLPNPMYYIP